MSQEREPEFEDRENLILKRLLATPPDHKRNVKSDASPKKRGSAAKAPESGREK